MAEPTIGLPGGGANPWWVVLAAAVPSVASGLWVFWRWWVDRGDSRAAVMLTREQGMIRELELQRAALSKEQSELLDRIRAELVRCQGRLGEVERDRDRGWDLARWWNRRAHELRHAGVNAQTAAQNAVLLRGRTDAGRLESDAGSAPADLVVPSWPDMSLPGLEEPK